MNAEPVATPTESILQQAERMAQEAEKLLATTSSLINKQSVRDNGDAHQTATAEPATHEEIDRKLERIYGVNYTPDGVLFRARGEGVREVQLAGDFNDWMPHTAPMKRVGSDFELFMNLPVGRYRYRMVVDGRWSHDMANPNVETNQYGEWNSVVEVRTNGH